MKIKNSLQLGPRLITLGLILWSILWIFPGEKVWGYTESDLWILEVSVNGDKTRTIDALVVGEAVYLPVQAVGALLDIPLSEVSAGQGLSFARPGDRATVLVDSPKRTISVNGEVQSFKEPLQLIAGQPFVLITVLGILTNAVFEYDYLHMAIQIRLATPESPPEKPVPSATEPETASPLSTRAPSLTLDGIHYRWATEASATKKGNDLKSMLNVWADGNLGDWRYRLRAYLQLDAENPAGLEQSYLSYDLDQATFRVGQATIQAGPKLFLDKVDYTGVFLVSHISPVVRMGGNLVNITGEAEGGARVQLFVNQWAVAEQIVDTSTQRYIFKDVQLPLTNAVNEVKVRIVKPSGAEEEIYRYIAVSETILNKNEVNYLVQTGKKSFTDPEVFFNSIVYWGVTDQTTMGLAWYGELPNGIKRRVDLLDYSFSSLQYNQRLSDSWVFKGTIYRAVEKTGNLSDTGYALNLSYKDQTTMVGFDYEKESQAFKSKLERPEEVFKVSCIHNLPPYGLLEGKAVFAMAVDNPQEMRKTGEFGYKLKKSGWESTLNLKSELTNKETINWQTNLDTTNSFLLTSNWKLVQNFNYSAYWNASLTENINLGLKGELVSGLSSYQAGVAVKASLSNASEWHLGQLTTTYSLTSLRRFKISPDETLNLEAGLQHEVSPTEYTDRLPLVLHYYHTLANQMNLEIEYHGTLEKTGDNLNIEHKLSVVLDGAFNIFGKKALGISPAAISQPGGIVQGSVFKDTNRNGQLDPGEPGLAGMQIYLDNRRMETDEKGNFCFSDVSPGQHRLGLDYSKLPVEYTSSTGEQAITVKANGEARCNLGVYIVGVVDGEVRIAEMPADISRAGIRVVLAPGEKIATTDYKGYYYFDQLAPGEYSLSLDLASLPAGVVAPTTEQEKKKVADEQSLPLAFRITEAGEYISGLNFYLHYSVPPTQSESPANVEQSEVGEQLAPNSPTPDNLPPATEGDGETLTSPEPAGTSTNSTGQGKPENLEHPTDANTPTDQTPVSQTYSPDETHLSDSAQSPDAGGESEVNVQPDPGSQTQPSGPTNSANQISQTQETATRKGILEVDFSTNQAKFNGEAVHIYPAFINDGQIWVPLRVVCQLFNCKVLWNPFHGIICIISENSHIMLGLESEYIFVDDAKVILKARARLINGFTYINLCDLPTFGFTGVMIDKDKLVIQKN